MRNRRSYLQHIICSHLFFFFFFSFLFLFSFSLQTNELHRAACAGNRKAVAKILQDNVIPIDSLDALGRTPLMHAVHFNRLDCADLLLRQGATVDHQEPGAGSTALHDAAYKGSPLMLCVLARVRARGE